MLAGAIIRFLLEGKNADATIRAEIIRLRFEIVMTTAIYRAVICFAWPCLFGGCVSIPTTITSHKLPTAPRGIVLVVDGAGGYQEAPRAVIAAANEARLPLYVRSFDWTLGNNLGVADMTDLTNARTQAVRLAAEIASYRKTYPDLPVYVIAHSAGAMIVLESTQCLDPDSIERIILLAPAVSADYDLRKALLTARSGIDVFTSKRDRLYLGLGVAMVGTADGKFGTPAAGRVGFDIPAVNPTDCVLLNRLHQHPWDPSVKYTGNVGNHSGTLRPAYLKCYVLPLLAASESANFN
jgi:Serine aminopeptidase, S33